MPPCRSCSQAAAHTEISCTSQGVITTLSQIQVFTKCYVRCHKNSDGRSANALPVGHQMIAKHRCNEVSIVVCLLHVGIERTLTQLQHIKRFAIAFVLSLSTNVSGIQLGELKSLTVLNHIFIHEQRILNTHYHVVGGSEPPHCPEKPTTHTFMINGVTLLLASCRCLSLDRVRIGFNNSSNSTGLGVWWRIHCLHFFGDFCLLHSAIYFRSDESGMCS